MSSSELNLVNNVDLKLALANSEHELEQSLNHFLCPLILKLASPHAEVRQAVFKTIQNVFPRITAARSLQLPVEALLSQVKHPNLSPGADSGNVKLYSLLFLSKGVERLDIEAQQTLVPQVIKGISSASTQVQARLFSILVKLLQAWKGPERGSDEVKSMRAVLGFDNNEADEQFLASKIGQFFLLLPSPDSTLRHSPGLSTNDQAFFTSMAGVSYKTQADVDETKLRLLEFLDSGFSDTCLAVPLLIASADSLTTTSEIAYSRFRKLTFDFDDTAIVETLISLFTGEENLRAPVKSTLQERILSQLCKCTKIVRHPKRGEISEIALRSDYAKLRQTGVVFVRKLTSMSDNSESSKNFTSMIASKLKESILSEGWPKADVSHVTNYRVALGLREQQYETLGGVLRNSPELWKDDLTYIEFFFSSLEGESIDIRPSLQMILSRLTIHLPGLSMEAKQKLKAMMRSYLEARASSSNSPCKYLAVKFVNSTFPFSDPVARYICILGTGKENNLETREEAKKGLHPYFFRLSQPSSDSVFQISDGTAHPDSTVFPSFRDMVTVINDSLNSPQKEIIQNIYSDAIQFILRVLVMSAVEGKSTVIVTDEDWIQRLEKSLEVEQTVRNLVAQKIESLNKVESNSAQECSNNSTIQLYLELVFGALYYQYFSGTNTTSDPVIISTFALLVSLSPSKLVGNLIRFIPQIISILGERSHSQQDLSGISKCLAMICTHENIDDITIESILESFCKEITSSKAKETYILVTCHILAKLTLRQRISEFKPAILDICLTNLVAFIEDSRLYDYCLEGLSQLAIFGTLGPILVISDDSKLRLQKITKKIESRAKNFHELSLLTFSKMALSLPSTYGNESEELNSIESVVYETYNTKQIEFIFSSGDALSVLAGGWSSQYLSQYLDLQGQSINYVPCDTGRLSPILKKVLSATKLSKPTARKAGCIWLLSIVQYLGHTQIVKDSATEIQSSFMKFLADRDELVQEAAARGLSMIFELSDNDLQETLVKSLLRSFTDSRASAALSAGTVDLETELFEKDVLKTHDSSVSTYKDVLNLASDVGDPSLVYKFMSLAKSNALWSSRKGMAFGLGSILSKASLDKMLSKNSNMSMRLIPKLYRYRFDPNNSVSVSMNGIWNALITDTSKTISEYFDAILSELLKGIGNKEWRVRQASAVALNNLLQTQRLDVYESQLEDIWNMSFRAMDDIKQSVRVEGQNLSKTLARVLMRSAELSANGSNRAKAAKAFDRLIPLLIGSKGLISDAEDVRTFALDTLLKLCDIGGDQIRPYIPLLLSNFIELMSTLEPEVINYLILNAEKYNLDSNDVDAKRIQSLGSSPMMNAIEKLIGSVDETIMPEVVKSLKSTVKKSVGLPSKACGSRAIISLISRKTGIVQPYCDQLLKVCIVQLKDKNFTVSQSYAIAAGYCCRFAGIDSIVAYSDYIKKSYLESEDKDVRKVSAIASDCVSRYCNADKFDTIASAFLPVAFVGKHDCENDVASVFENEWTEYSSGNSAIKLYFREIFNICEACIKSVNYNIRQIAARSIADVCDSLDSLSKEDLDSLFNILLDACKGKSWDGKELVVDSLVEMSLKNSSYVLDNSELMKTLFTTVITEEKRRNKHYQINVSLSVGKFINGFPQSSDLISLHIETMHQILSDEYLEDIDILEGEKAEIEDFYLRYIQSLVKSISPRLIRVELLQFSLKSMKLFVAGRHEKSWKTCFSFNENFTVLLDLFSSGEPDPTDLAIVVEGFSILQDFGDSYRLEKNALIYAKNCQTLLALCKKYRSDDDVQPVKDHVRQLRSMDLSSVAIHELDKVISFYK